MAGIPYLFVFLLAGCFCVRCLLPGKAPLVRGWLGITFGLLLMMWLPTLAAFFFKFSVKGHLLALIPLAAICAALFLLRDKSAAARWGETDRRLLWPLLSVALPLVVLSGYLLYTHVLFPSADGSLHTGQSTYGDMNLHLSIISSLRNAAFPADYAILPGMRLCYPFLTDSLSTSLMLFGMNLRGAVIIPSVIMLLCVFSGYVLFTCRVADTRRGAVLAALLFFINGGLGFVYLMDMRNVSLGAIGDNQLQAASSLLGRIQNVLQGWYQSPTNQAEFTTYNLRWSNVIVDMLIPQRTTMGGWCMLLPCLYLLYDFAWGVQAENPVPARKAPWRQIVLLGVMAGALPMVHTHSFLALALISAGWMVYSLLHAPRGTRGARFMPWLLYGGLAACLALPQLFTWTFSQAQEGGFLTFQFNWVNNLNNSGLQDGYFWFYLKNIGLPFLLLLLSLFEKNKKRRFLASGAFVIFVLAEFVLFQPNEYDNNKLFYVWYMICAILAADYAVELFDRMKGLRSRYAVAALACFVFFASGTLSIAAECVSDYRLFSMEEAQAAEFVEHNTDEHAVFMTSTQHINPVSSLAGRTIVCGPGLWLHWHGFNTTQREEEISAFYRDPTGHMDTLLKYGVSYIMVSSYERSAYTIDYPALTAAFDLVFESEYGEVAIYQVRE